MTQVSGDIAAIAAGGVANIVAVCSARPRPSVQKGPKGNQWWRRDVYHLSAVRSRTLCGRDSSEWLKIGEVEPNDDCCTKCRAAYHAYLEGHSNHEHR